MKLRREWFDSDEKVFVSRSPGRLDVMGGIADYSGANVFEMPLENSVTVGCQRRRDDRLRVMSLNAEGEGFDPKVELTISDLIDKPYDRLHAFFSSNPRRRWAGYVLGAFPVLAFEGVVERFPSGANILIDSTLPMGAGISSSAALEVASMCSILACYGLKLDPMRIAALCQIVENRIVGAPCGIMDQITSVMGRKNRLISILCRPGEVLEQVEIPDFIRFVGINSRVKRSTAGEAYTRTRTATFMGFTIMLRRFDLKARYLCEVSPEEFRGRFAQALPLRIKGEEFLRRYGDTLDAVTKVNPDETYRVRSCTEHPIYENRRVKRFVELIKSLNRFDSLHEAIPTLKRAGSLMYGSHWSYKYRAGLGCRETDMIVRFARKLGVEMGIFGAKITGGGGGGTVAVLCSSDSDWALEEICSRYRSATGLKPDLFIGSSDGAASYGIKVHPAG
ncbi:TPA: GHMP kinase [Candidatus Poribacteria bacterium]|nr:GHMP kinase [Candidatus Poribacteria bacterium]